MFPLHALYPLMKRWTYWPQAWLGMFRYSLPVTPPTDLNRATGLAMNWGYVVAWISITGSLDAQVVWPFFLGTVWYVLPLPPSQTPN